MASNPLTGGDLAAVEAWLYSLRNRGSRLGLERMEALLRELGDPHHGLPIVHVAGTNGKGSVCSMIDAIARAAGYRVGLFTSPHLLYLGERVQVDRVPLPRPRLLEAVGRMRPLAARLGADDSPDHPSFFEFMTALALDHFRREGVDLVVLETGLGGRLDSTNVVDPLVAVITSVSLDHTEYLGSTIAAIAREKAGIIKHGRPVVMGCLAAEAEGVVREVAASREAPVYSVRERFGDAPDGLPLVALKGAHQRLNAGMAVLACEVLNGQPGCPLHFDAAAIHTGLQSVRWAGRWDSQTLGDGTRLIFEAAHNPEGAEALAAQLDALASSGETDITAVVGILGKDRAPAILSAVAPRVARLILVAPDQPRACAPADLAGMVPPLARCRVELADVGAVFPGPGLCTAGGAGRTVVVTGSIYLIGEVMGRIAAAEESGGQWQDRLP